MLHLRLDGRIWLETEAGERFMGIGRMELLQHIQRTGSISQAAKAMQMSYKRAWDLVQSLNQLAGHPLVLTQTGGQKGGGTLLTEAGLTYLTQYEALQVRFQAFLTQETERVQAELASLVPKLMAD